ncbi:MAG: histidine kinase N-terminal domain-containing protein [Chloroflexota bacterium]
MHATIRQCLNLTEEGIAFLHTIERQMGIVADLSRADILLYGRWSQKEAVVLSHARPHSLAHVYLKNREGRVIDAKRRPEVLQALISGLTHGEERSTIAEGAPVVRQTWPIYFPHPFGYWQADQRQYSRSRVIAALVIVTNLIEHERHRLRSKVFRQALKKLQAMLLYGQVPGAEALSPFGEQDGILFVDNDGIIQYASGIAANLYRRLGYRETLIGRPLSALETTDEEIRRAAIGQNQCLERETREESQRIWIHKALPLVTYPAPYWSWLKKFNLPVPAHPRRYGVMLALTDATEARRQDQEIRVKNAMIQEVHHRVKNNLQTIAGLLRMQARRVKSEEARLALDEALTRILSVAVIHEFLSNASSNIINIKEVSQRIMAQFKQGMLNPDKEIRLELRGDSIFLPARQATACSLIINELLQNAVEHGFEHKQQGFIKLNLEDTGDEVIINVIDNGEGLPANFELEQTTSLGYQIVRTLVEGDLNGQIHMANTKTNGEGLAVTIQFPKSFFRGEEGWKEHVSL